ncbi:MAG: LysM peptidoglycan-binding domain-containing protein [Proteobacteria bacterium]|nr:MAG: LysM peptidoglycan-binding domain-containing protein [Pseudomonadota bacterium]
MAKLWWPIIILLLLSACASRPPARVDEINTRQQSRQAQSLKHRKLTPTPLYYRVQKGDSLYAIGFRYDIDYRQLAAINNIKPPYIIRPNQRLRLKPAANHQQKPEAQQNKASTRAIAQQPAITAQTEPKPINRNNSTTSQNPPTETPQQKTTVTVSQQPAKTKPVVNLPQSGKLNWLWPTEGKIRTTFSGSNPARKGISIRGQEGQDVKATEAGVVVYSGDGLLGYGELIIIKHNDSFLSAYGHNKKRHVKEGQQVKRGDVIAQLGSSGTNVNNLHFEIRKNGQPVNPLDYVKP